MCNGEVAVGAGSKEATHEENRVGEQCVRRSERRSKLEARRLA
jgi:hypothetical protein